MTTTNKMVEIGRGNGSSVQHHYAKRADGQWFVRYQDRSAYGYRWTAWRKCSAPSTWYADPYLGLARLPKD